MNDMKLIVLILSTALPVVPGLTSASAAAAEAVATQATAAHSPATALARLSGAVVGSAIFCQIEEGKQEIFLDRAQAQIALTARDKVDLVVARIAFSNEMNHASAIEPDGGCEEFSRQFSARIAGLE